MYICKYKEATVIIRLQYKKIAKVCFCGYKDAIIMPVKEVEAPMAVIEAPDIEVDQKP